MLPDLFIQQLKQYSDIERVVSGYVQLKKKGRYLVGLCPFHSEKSGSFFIYPQTQSFYCFGCGAGGDVITFIRRIENLEYMEAVKFLADKCGLEVPEMVGPIPEPCSKRRCWRSTASPPGFSITA